MTISSTTLRNDYPGDNTTVTFAFEFVVLQETTGFTIRVIVTDANGIETEQVQDVDYTVSLGTNGTGTITFTTAPALNTKITLLSNVPRTQQTDYINIGTDKFPADSHENTVDKLTLMVQNNDEKLKRAITLPESSALTDLTIPVSTENADKAIVVNSAGDNIDAKNLADIGTAPVTDFAKTLLDDNTAGEARDTLDSEQKINSLSSITSLEDLDEFGFSDDSDSDNSKKITFEDLKKNIVNGSTAITTLEATDQIPVADNSDSDRTKKIVVSDLRETLSSTTTEKGTVEKATEAEMEAETADKYPDAATLKHHPGVAKAWVKFNGTGTVSILDSYNVSSITDHGVGDWTVNFTNAFANADYVGVGMGLQASGNNPVGVEKNSNRTATTSSFPVVAVQAPNRADIAEVFVAFFGEQ